MRFFLHLKTLFFIILIGITFSSCSYKDVEVVKVDNIKLGKVKSDIVSFNANIHIKNPNNYKIKVSKYDLDIKVNKQSFKMVEPEADILIPKRYDGNISVPLTMKSKDILSFRTITTLYKLFTSKKIELGAKGSVSIKFLFFSKKIKVDEKKTIDF
jgi:LEA14-like dessication related protein